MGSGRAAICGHGYWIRGDSERMASQWVAAVGDGVVGDVVHLLSEGHQGLKVLALTAVEVHLRLDVGFENPQEGAPPLSRAVSRFCSTSWLKLAM